MTIFKSKFLRNALVNKSKLQYFLATYIMQELKQIFRGLKVIIPTQ